MKNISVLILMITAPALCVAQELRLNLYSAFVFDDKFSSYYDSYNYYDGKIKGGYQWGAGLEYFLIDQYSLELSYQHQNTIAPTRYQIGIAEPTTQTDLDMNISYLMAGGMRHIVKPDGKVEGYAGLMLGGAFLNATNPETHREASATKFAWGARIGANFWASERVGIKLQAQLLSVVQGAGGGFYFGTGGSGVGVSAYSTVYQFCLGGGLTFRVK